MGSWRYNLSTGDLEGKKILSVGTRPVILNQFKPNHIFACSDRPVVINQSPTRRGQLIASNVNLKLKIFLIYPNTKHHPV